MGRTVHGDETKDLLVDWKTFHMEAGRRQKVKAESVFRLLALVMLSCVHQSHRVHRCTYFIQVLLFELSYRLISWLALVHGAVIGSKHPPKLDGGVECVHNFLRLFISLRVFYAYCICFLMLQSKSVMNGETRKWTATAVQVHRPRTKETRPVMRCRDIDCACHERLVYGWGPVLTVRLSASMSGGRSLTVMEEDRNWANVKGDGS